MDTGNVPPFTNAPVSEKDNHLEKIKKLYLDPAFAGSARGITGFYRELKRTKQDYNLSIYDIKAALETMSSYTQQVPSIVRFPRRHITKIGLGHELQLDLAELPESPTNFKFVLVAIDIFSQMLYTKALSNKTSATVARAFREIINENQNPLSLLECVASDFGGEFRGPEFVALLKEKHIKQFLLRSPSHAALAENAIRHLKRRLFTLMRAKFMNQWDELLPSVTSSINESFNTAIGTSAIEANKWYNEPQIRSSLEANLKRRDASLRKKYRNIKERDFAIGSYVMPDYKRLGTVGTKESDLQRGQVYQIYNKNTDESPALYYLKDLHNKKVPGCYYSFEMQPAVNPKSKTGEQELHAVERIVDRRTDPDGTRWSLVKWANYPSRYIYKRYINFEMLTFLFVF